MSIKQIVFTVLGIIICLFSIWGLVLDLRAERLNNWLTLEQIDQRVRTNLPPGATLSEIDRYFSVNNVEHSYYEPGNEVAAMIHSIWGGAFLVQKDAQIKIQLD